jgi:glycosyltransferase involved in cell wall biosynthesis
MKKEKTTEHSSEGQTLNVVLIYYEPIQAGQTTHVLSLARGLREHGHHVSVILPANLKYSIENFRQADVNVIPLPLRKVLWPPRSILATARTIRQQQPDIVHIHSQEAGLLGRIIAWGARAKAIVYTPQVIDIRRKRWHWLYVLVEHLLARITDRIISVSEADRERMIEWGIPSPKIVNIPNGIELKGNNVNAEQARKALNLSGAYPVIMQVGRLSTQKNPLAFVEGAAQVLHQHPNAQFVLVGEGPLKEAIQLRAEYFGMNGAMRLLGWQDNAADLMAAADIISLTSEWEGMPHTLLEAMDKSRPVVATEVNGCPEIIEDHVTGFLVPPDDTTSWAKRIVELLDNPTKMKEMGQRGRERAQERFSRQKMIAQIEHLYSQLLEL